MSKRILVKILVAVFIVFLVLNLIVLDILIFKNGILSEKLKQAIPNNIQQENNFDKDAVKKLIQQEITSSVPSSNSNVCPNSCLAQIFEATKSALSKIPTNTSSSVVQTSSVKEFFVPFGAGLSQAEDWQDVTGAQAYIDSTQYGSIKKVVFEASLYTPTGSQTAYARLYNKTDMHPVWNSEVVIEGGTPHLLISSPIQLDSGNKLYQVQMKTQLKHITRLDQSRLHITTY